MSKEFEQISLKSGFMKHNGGLLFKEISKTEFEFKTIVKENHLNTIGITHERRNLYAGLMEQREKNFLKQQTPKKFSTARRGTKFGIAH